MHRDEIIRRIEQYFGAELLLKARQVDQFLANGIQVHGKEDVQTIVVGVSATQELFQQAKQEHADMILCKHPLRIDVPFQVLDPSLETRLRTIFTENWTVGGYHYVLDVHPEVGNAPLLLKKLGANITGSFYDDWGFTARLPQPQLLSALQEKLQNIVHHPVFMVAPPGVESVQTLGLVTGGAVPKADRYPEFLAAGIQLYITGEISEWTVHLFRELGIAYFAAGHHATEVLGPKKFAQILPKLLENQVNVKFLNIWNEI